MATTCDKQQYSRRRDEADVVTNSVTVTLLPASAGHCDQTPDREECS